MHSDTDFTEDERAMLADLERQENLAIEQSQQEEAEGNPQGEQPQAAAQDAPAGEASATPEGPAAAAPAAEPEKDPTQAPAAQDPQAKKPGDLRNALRASRRAERAAREEAERLRQEIEDLKAGKKSDDSTALTDEELAEMEVDFPAQAAAIRKLNDTVKQLKTAAAPAPAAPAPEEFIPPTLVPELQEVVDEIPELLDMQNDPDQTRWQLAVEADRLLHKSPKWANKPLAQRLAEAARIANEQVGAAPAPSPAPAPAPSPQPQSNGGKSSLEQAKARIESAPTPQPTSISDIRGGASPSSKTAPDYSRMSDEEIMSSLG